MIDKKIKLFHRLEIETHSECNRKCVTCLRNSIPDREATKSWFEPNSLSSDDFKRVLEQSVEIGFRGEVCLSHYNEPLMDERIVDLIKLTKSMGFSRIFMGSNADFLTEDLAKELDGQIDHIGFSFYMDEPKKSERMRWVKSLFNKTTISLSPGDHMITHFSPTTDVIQIGKKLKNEPCHNPKRRLIINHKGEMLLCCDDMIGHFDLGSIHNNTVEELWYSEKHQEYVLKLSEAGGRMIHPHCETCPRS